MGWRLKGSRRCAWSLVVGALLVLLLASCGTATRGGNSEPSQTRAAGASERLPAEGGCGGRGSLPRNGRIAFTANSTSDISSEEFSAPGDIYTVEPDGSSLRRLTTNLGATQAAWAPDGRQIAFVRVEWRDRYNKSRLWLMNADGSGEHGLTGLGDRVGSPAWSPDGNSIAFGGPHGIAVLDLRTRDVRRLSWSVPHWYPPEGAVWSADGKHLLVVAESKRPAPDDTMQATGLFTVRASDGLGAAKLPRAKSIRGYDWSRANCRVVFASGLATRGGECNGDLFTTNAHLLRVRLLLAMDCAQLGSVWAPDGRRVAFQHNGGVWVANSDGSDPHQVAAPFRTDAIGAGARGSLGPPAWQPLP